MKLTYHITQTSRLASCHARSSVGVEACKINAFLSFFGAVSAIFFHAEKTKSLV